MPKYPKQPLEEKLVWMRARQQEKAQEEARVLAQEAIAAPRQQTVTTEALLRELIVLLRDLAVHLSAQPQAAPAVPQMLRVDQVAKILSVSTKTVQRWFADCAINVEAGPVRTTMLIPQQALSDWYKEHQAKGQE